MRLWHYRLLPYLPDAQLKGQLRELVAIMRDWRDKGKTNHILINAVMCFDKAELLAYWKIYRNAYEQRYGKSPDAKYDEEFSAFASGRMRYWSCPVFYGWHDRAYLRICMANLYEKYHCGRGLTRITDKDWQRLCDGYEEITGEVYRL